MMASTSSSLAISAVGATAMSSRICIICMASEEQADLSNIMEVGPDKENWSNQVNHYFGIKVDTKKPDGNASMICWSCLKPVIDWTGLRKDCLIRQIVSKYFSNQTQGKKLPQVSLSEFCSELKLKIIHPTSEVITESSLETIAESCIERIAGSSLERIAGSSLEPIAESPLKSIPESSLEPIAGPPREPVTGAPREPVAGPSREQLVGPFKEPIARPYREPVARSFKKKVARLSKRPVARPSREQVAGPSREPVAGPSWASDAGLSRVPLVEPSRESVAGPSRESVAGPSREPVARPYREPVARSFKKKIARLSKSPVARPSKEPVAELSRKLVSSSFRKPLSRPFRDPVAGSSRDPVAGSSREPVAGPSRESVAGPSREPVAGPSREPVSGPSREPTVRPFSKPVTRPYKKSVAKLSKRPVVGPSKELVAGPSREPVAGPSREPVTGPSRERVAGPWWTSGAGPWIPVGGPSREPVAGSSREPVVGPLWASGTGPWVPVAGPSWASDTGPYREPVTVPSIEPVARPSREPVAGPSWASGTGPWEPVAGPSWASDAGPYRESVAGPSREPVAGPSREPVAGPSREPVAGPSREPVAGPSWASDAGPSREPIAGPSWEPVAGPSWASDAGLSRKRVAGPSREPVAGPSWEPVAGPSWASDTGFSRERVAGSSREPVAGSSREPVAGPSWASDAGLSLEPVAGPSREAVAGPSWEPVAGPSWTSSAGQSRDLVAGPSWEPVAGPSWAPVAGPSSEPVVGSSIISSSVLYVPTNSSNAPSQMKNKFKIVKNGCPFCNSNSVNCRQFQYDNEMKLCSRHIRPYTCLLKDCNLVFPNRDVFISHYRSHLKLKKQTYLCRKCLSILVGSRNVKRTTHTHQDTSKLFNCCSDKFSSMSEFVLHKLQKHSTIVTVIMNNAQMKKYVNDVYSLKLSSCVTTINLPQENRIQLYTCLVPHCDRVYNMISNNTEHFKEHAAVPESYSVCSICLVYSFSDGFNLHCSHSNPLISCAICNTSFTTLFDLAVHKIIFHKSVILCGLENVPGCSVCSFTFKSGDDPNLHYIQCFKNINKNLAIQSNKILTNTINTNTKVKRPIATTNLDASFTCKTCGTETFSLTEYVTHVKKHNVSYTTKDDNILLCPVCDKNYEKSDYLEHMSRCSKSMELSEDCYGCACCHTKIYIPETYKYRIHYMYCKTIDKLKDCNSETYYKCINCNFVNYDLVTALRHATAHCIYFQLKMRYSMSADETDKVKKRKLEISENEKLDIKPINTAEEYFNPKTCNRKRQKLLEMYEYLCNTCNKRFYDSFIFKRHLSIRGGQCRPPELEYCIYCACDFSSIETFSLHLSGEAVEEKVQSPTHKPIKCEMIDDAMSTRDDEMTTNDDSMANDGSCSEYLDSHNINYANDCASSPDASNVTSYLPFLRSELFSGDDDSDSISLIGSDDFVINDECINIEDEKPDTRNL